MNEFLTRVNFWVIFSDTVYVRSFKHSLMISSVELYLCVSVLITLTLFQGYTDTGNVKLKVVNACQVLI